MDGSPVPVPSVATTVNVCCPGGRLPNETGLVHGASGAESSAHSVETSAPETNVNVASANGVDEDGPVWIGTVGCRGPSAWWSHAALFASRFGSATVHFSP